MTAAHRSPLVLAGLESALASVDSLVHSGSRSCVGLIAELLETAPDIVLVEYEQVVRGQRWVSRIQGHPSARLVLYGGKCQADSVQLALRLGAVGLVHDSVEADRLVQGLLDIMRGRSFFHLVAGEETPATAPTAPRRTVRPELTEREAQVLRLLALRLTNAEIAERLSLTQQTVKNYTSHIFRKLGVSGRRGLLDLDVSELLEATKSVSAVDVLDGPR